MTSTWTKQLTSKWTHDLTGIYSRCSYDAQDLVCFTRSKWKLKCTLLEEDHKHFYVLMKYLISDLFSKSHSLSFLENKVPNFGSYHLLGISLQFTDISFVQHVLINRLPNHQAWYPTCQKNIVSQYHVASVIDFIY